MGSTGPVSCTQAAPTLWAVDLLGHLPDERDAVEGGEAGSVAPGPSRGLDPDVAVGVDDQPPGGAIAHVHRNVAGVPRAETWWQSEGHRVGARGRDGALEFHEVAVLFLG